MMNALDKCLGFKIKKWIIVGTILILFLAGCTYLPFIQRIKLQQIHTESKSRILSYYVVHNAPDHLALAVKYHYAGGEGECVYIGAMTLTDGNSDGYWAIRPDPVFKGDHWAHILIGMNQESPNKYENNEIQFEMYRCGSSVFADATVPFKKRWQRLEKPSICHLHWGKGCGG